MTPDSGALMRVLFVEDTFLETVNGLLNADLEPSSTSGVILAVGGLTGDGEMGVWRHAHAGRRRRAHRRGRASVQ